MDSWTCVWLENGKQVGKNNSTSDRHTVDSTTRATAAFWRNRRIATTTWGMQETQKPRIHLSWVDKVGNCNLNLRVADSCQVSLPPKPVLRVGKLDFKQHFTSMRTSNAVKELVLKTEEAINRAKVLLKGAEAFRQLEVINVLFSVLVKAIVCPTRADVTC